MNSEPWLNEPSRKHWVDPSTGLDCLIVRHPTLGHLCGYVGVPHSHPFYGRHYSNYDDNADATDIKINNLEVHGGLTYAKACSDKICYHYPKDNIANSDVWWFGFDCAHAGDSSPLMNQRMGWSHSNKVYSTIEYVKEECRKLASQIKEAQ